MWGGMSNITVETPINEPVEKVWEVYTNPAHITRWSYADDSWHAPYAENDLRPGGRFRTRMESKDGSAGFDFTGTYTQVVPHKKIAYTMDGADTRKVIVEFEEFANSTTVIVTFDPEDENPIEMQRSGWQSILENFKKYVEAVRE